MLTYNIKTISNISSAKDQIKKTSNQIFKKSINKRPEINQVLTVKTLFTASCHPIYLSFLVMESIFGL